MPGQGGRVLPLSSQMEHVRARPAGFDTFAI